MSAKVFVAAIIAFSQLPIAPFSLLGSSAALADDQVRPEARPPAISSHAGDRPAQPTLESASPNAAMICGGTSGRPECQEVIEPRPPEKKHGSRSEGVPIEPRPPEKKHEPRETPGPRPDLN